MKKCTDNEGITQSDIKLVVLVCVIVLQLAFSYDMKYWKDFILKKAVRLNLIFVNDIFVHRIF
ncbi:MAG: hypothetical protein ACXADL_01550 [Candidatus Thorarchaeota archaeon]